MREHLFITVKRDDFEKCHKFQIFGVGERAINQLGLVNKGDKVFFLIKEGKCVIGPYVVASDIFYNEDIIWEGGKDEIDSPYRVKLKSDFIYKMDIEDFSQIVEERGIRLDSRDLWGKSVFTFLPKDTGIIEPLLKEKWNPREMPVEKEFQETNITVELAQKHGFIEAFLEYFLLKNFTKYFGDDKLFLYNQFRIDLLGSKIDIIALNEKKILVFELKKEEISNADVNQFKKYISWIEKNKKLLERFFKVSLNNAEIQKVMIGSGIRKNLSTDIPIKKYSLENNELSLSNI